MADRKLNPVGNGASYPKQPAAGRLRLGILAGIGATALGVACLGDPDEGGKHDAGVAPDVLAPVRYDAGLAGGPDVLAPAPPDASADAGN